MSYNKNLTKYQRRKTKTVTVGNVKLGGDLPIRLQSMTNTLTKNIDATVAQCIRIVNAGADFVRITAPGVKDAETLKTIKQALLNKGYTIPLVADIHFSAKAAEIAASIVEKVRINPGNYIDKRSTEKKIFSESEYLQEIENIKTRFAPLIEICKKFNTAIRIGVNHGSLSNRIMDKYGDTPEGMAESAMEFLRICQELNFHNVVVSMKASNTRVMVYANRLLVKKMAVENMDYPLHLGVTEAGEGEDGRIKSAVGIGAMLVDGIGETIRVSLTEAPEKEIPVAQKIVNHIHGFNDHDPIPDIDQYPLNAYEYQRRRCFTAGIIGGENVPVVIADISGMNVDSPTNLKDIGWHFDKNNNRWSFNDDAADFLFAENIDTLPAVPSDKGIILPFKVWSQEKKQGTILLPLIKVNQYLSEDLHSGMHRFLIVELKDLTPTLTEKIKRDDNIVLVCKTGNQNGIAEQRRFFIELINRGVFAPVIIQKVYDETDTESFQLKSACDTGPLFIDGLGDGVWLRNINNQIPLSKINQTAFGILQASRTRTTKTEYISCPGCGRTLFNLEETTAKIRAHTSHLKGLKIGIMGCIVNGPGEMADADYGYVGAGKGKITLYRNKEVIKKNIPEQDAIDELIDLIKSNGDWVERTLK